MPEHISRPPYVGSNMLPELSNEYQVHDDDGIAHMKAACELAARVLNFAGTLVRVRNLFHSFGIWYPQSAFFDIY